MISFENLTKAYQGTTVLGSANQGVSGEIETGGITSIIGANGAGKSTLLTILGRLLDPTTGIVHVGGLDVARTPSATLARKLAILRQDNHTTARLRVRELVAMGRFPHSRGRLTPGDLAAVEQAMEFVNLTELADRFIDQMSGGQRQRAFIAMVLAQDADYILLDEPLNNLDMRHSVQMMQQLRRAADELGRTVVMVMHDLNFAAAYSDQLMAMADGQVVAHGPVRELMDGRLLTGVFGTPVQVMDVDGSPTAVYCMGKACPPGMRCSQVPCCCEQRDRLRVGLDTTPVGQRLPISPRLPVWGRRSGAVDQQVGQR